MCHIVGLKFAQESKTDPAFLLQLVPDRNVPDWYLCLPSRGKVYPPAIRDILNGISLPGSA
jgi:hypothetical protein